MPVLSQSKMRTGMSTCPCHLAALLSPTSDVLYNAPPMPDSPSETSSEPGSPLYKRVLLKISGEGFCHEGGFGIEAQELENIARQCVEVARMGVQLAIVLGRGHFIRGATFADDGNIPRATADYMGMLATVLNAVALQETM